MERFFFVAGSVSAFVAVGLGAFAAHGLKGRLSSEMVNVFETGVRYQMYHAVALLLVGWAASRWPGAGIVAAGWLFLAGTLIFSGTLYLLSVTGLRWLGAITPIGGVAFLLGWVFLAWGAWKYPGSM
ncbi:MAG: DUF423 domain-containing protein [Deltaproteobacteria bacterium]|nr:DUF423 domain-containing protein [Deltaproteobacteria bacterium]